MQAFIAYQGKKFTIEWYFNDRGTSDPQEYFEKLNPIQKEKIFYLFRLFGEMGKIKNKEKFRYEGDQIYAFKASANRFLCFFFDGKKVIVTSAYKKESTKIPYREKKKALKAKDDYEKRNKTGSYYD